MIWNVLISSATMGIDSGLLMTIYGRINKQAHFLNAEDKPLADEKNMFKVAGKESSKCGPLAIGLINYQIKSLAIGKLIKKLVNLLSFIYLSLKKINTLPIFCKIIKIIADKDANEFYNGRLGELLIENLNDLRIIMTIEDLKNYSVQWTDPAVTNSSNGKKKFTSNLPGHGELLVLIARGPGFTDMTDSLKNITSKDFARNIKNKVDDERTWNESSHYGWADNLLKNHGISQVSVIAPNSDAVVVSSSLNSQ
ncbi:glutathione hydrolase 1-like [Aphidius gifuensis]|uniref:glutathione hydrolase 1-like n=1 Tax=Aphidius gifuensis TaxID=684658 RepID=UPI001CDCC782|nr:glutathione hydrolase 1-like [Aphidius gifuensis]